MKAMQEHQYPNDAYCFRKFNGRCAAYN